MRCIHLSNDHSEHSKNISQINKILNILGTIVTEQIKDIIGLKFVSLGNHPTRHFL